MKKTLRIITFAQVILFLVMMLPPLASATTVFKPGEVFVLRNDIKFGDSMEEVRAKETLVVKPFNPESPNSLVTEEGTVAGLDGVSLSYGFYENEKGLGRVYWNVPDFEDKDIANNTYEKLYNAIVSKYGKPLDLANDETFVITGKTIEFAYSYVAFANSMRAGSSGMIDKGEWVVDCEGNNNTKIELVNYYASMKYGTVYHIKLSYTHFTDEELASALQEKLDEQDAILDDI